MLMEKPQCNFQNCRYCFDGNCYSADKYENCKLTDLHCEIARLTVDLDNAKSEWISVEERLPDQDGKYLAYTRKGFTVLSYYYALEGGFGFEHWDVTHWMPLPEAPKGGVGE